MTERAMVSEMLRESEAAELLGVSARTLQRWRLDGEGPRAVKLGPRLVRYRREDLEAWLRQQGESA